MRSKNDAMETSAGIKKHYFQKAHTNEVLSWFLITCNKIRKSRGIGARKKNQPAKAD